MRCPGMKKTNKEIVKERPVLTSLVSICLDFRLFYWTYMLAYMKLITDVFCVIFDLNLVDLTS